MTLTLLVQSVSLFSQSTCKCDTVFKQIVQKVETEYPGFGEKTKDIAGYNSFKNSLFDSVKTASNINCQRYLEQYCNYFKDGHLVLVSKNQNKSETVSTDYEIMPIEISTFEKELLKSKDNIEGIWISGGYKVGIKKQNDIYVGFIISSENESWKPKEIKFKLLKDREATYYKGNHSEIKETYSLQYDCVLNFKGVQATYIKQQPSPKLSKDSIAVIQNEIEGFYLKPVSEKTLLIRLSSFDYEYVDRIKGLIESNKSKVCSFENLIIDLRGNGGGTDNAYRPLLPYIYTNPVRYLSGEYLVSKTLMDNLERWANTADTAKNSDEIKSVRKDIERMKPNIGKFIAYSENENFGFTIQDSIYPNPKEVVILVDKKCGSSTEKFVLNAKQSKKVKIMGTNTYGAVDYVSVMEFKIDCQNYSIYMPTIRMMRLPDYPIDNIGIQPDIYLDRFVNDWIEYAKNYLEQ